MTPHCRGDWTKWRRRINKRVVLAKANEVADFGYQEAVELSRDRWVAWPTSRDTGACPVLVTPAGAVMLGSVFEAWPKDVRSAALRD